MCRRKEEREKKIAQKKERKNPVWKPIEPKKKKKLPSSPLLEVLALWRMQFLKKMNMNSTRQVLRNLKTRLTRGWYRRLITDLKKQTEHKTLLLQNYQINQNMKEHSRQKSNYGPK